MEIRQKRLDDPRKVLLSPDGLAKIIALHVQTCGNHPRMELSPYQIIESIADCEYERRTGRPFNETTQN